MKSIKSVPAGFLLAINYRGLIGIPLEWRRPDEVSMQLLDSAFRKGFMSYLLIKRFIATGGYRLYPDRVTFSDSKKELKTTAADWLPLLPVTVQ